MVDGLLSVSDLDFQSNVATALIPGFATSLMRYGPLLGMAAQLQTVITPPADRRILRAR